MKRTFVVAALVTALLAVGPAASANPAPDKRVTVLQRQVKSLTAQVTQMKKQITFLTNELNANYLGDACSDAVTAATFRGTWQTIDGKQTSGSPWFDNNQPAINDNNSCRSLIGTKPTVAQPPQLSIFDDLIRWILGLP